MRPIAGQLAASHPQDSRKPLIDQSVEPTSVPTLARATIEEQLRVRTNTPCACIKSCLPQRAMAKGTQVEDKYEMKPVPRPKDW